MRTFLSTICLVIITSLSFGQRLQTPTLSPITKITQQIGLTEIGLEYSRPSAKERIVFGELVPFDKIWRTGANASTKITLEESAEIGGNPVEQGTHAIYTIPGKDKWTIIIHSNTKMRSLAGGAYKKENDLFRFEVVPEKTKDYVDTFTLQFANLTSNTVQLKLSWENTVVNIPIKVEVDKKIAKQMETFLKQPEKIPHRTYFEAAQYNLNNKKDLNEALNWINAGLDKSPKNFRYGLLKAKIYAKQGDKKMAMKTIIEANTWAVQAKNENYIEQTALFQKSLEKK